MNKSIILTLFLLCLSSSLALKLSQDSITLAPMPISFNRTDGLNPGFQLEIKIAAIEKLKDVAFPMIMAQLKDFSIDDFSEGSLNVTDLKAVIDIPEASKVQICYDHEGNGIAVRISDISMDMSANWSYKDGPFLNFKGSLTAHGVINSIDLTMFMLTAGETNLIPQLNLTNVKLDAPTSKWDVKINASGIPSFLTNLIIGLFKNVILNTVFDTLET